MAAENAKQEKKKVALTLTTYEALKDFSRFNGLKLRLAVDSMVEILLRDEALREEVIVRTRARQEED